MQLLLLIPLRLLYLRYYYVNRDILFVFMVQATNRSKSNQGVYSTWVIYARRPEFVIHSKWWPAGLVV
jgi:hypothetical protein